MQSKTAPSEFSAADIEIITGISVDTQKDWRKRIGRAGLPPLGRLRGHWLYSWADICLLKLVEEVKSSGLPVDNALELVLRDGDGSIRRDLSLVVAAHLVGYDVNPPALWLIPIERHGWSLASELAVEFDGRRPVAGTPVDLADLFDRHRSCSRIAVINVSLLVQDIIRHVSEIAPLADELDRLRSAGEVSREH